MPAQAHKKSVQLRWLSLAGAIAAGLTLADEVAPAPAAEETLSNATVTVAPAAVVTTPAPALAPAVVPAAPAVAPVPGAPQLISLTLDDVPLGEVVRLFTRISGANIIAATSNLQGQVTANLQEVQWRPAFESILERQNLQLVEKPPASGIYVIEGRKPGEDPRISTTVRLNYAKVVDVATLVTGILGKDGTATPFAAANSIVLNASALKAAEIKKIIESLDRPRTQVSIETKIVQLTDGTSSELGIDWQGLNNYTLGSQLNANYNRNANDVLTRTSTTTKNYDQFGNLLTPTPVAGAVTLAGQQPVLTTTLTDLGNNQVTTLRGLSAVLTPSQFNVVLGMLEGTTGTKLISNPKIIVANEEKALIKMAQDEPNITLTVLRSTVQGQSDQITSTLNGAQPFFTYGITVEVTPRVNTSSNITVTIKPELSTKVTEKTAPDGNTFPIIDKKSVETIFSLADGSTAAIGGLITTSDSDTTSKVPLLGDIPFLGNWLFSYRSRAKSQAEVLIFVTVKLVDPQVSMDPAQLPSETALYLKRYPGDSVLNLTHTDVTTTNTAPAQTNSSQGLLWNWSE